MSARAAWGWGGLLVAAGLLAAGAAGNSTHAQGHDTVVSAAAHAHLAVGYRFPNDGWMGTYSVDDRPTFCIDLNGRGPSTATGYTAGPAGTVKKQVGWSPDHKGGNAEALTGPALTVIELGQLAYLTDRYAATTSPVTAAAAEHVVRLLTVGDPAQAQREKVRWAQTVRAHPKVAAAYDAMARDVHDHAGPYTLKATWATTPTATTTGVLAVTLTSATGLPMRKVAISAAVTGGVSLRATTDTKGTARLSITPVSKGDLQVTVTARNLPAAAPLLYTPARYADPRSPDHAAQRTVGAAPRTSPTATAGATISAVTPKATTTAHPAKPTVNSDLTDDVTVTGAVPGYRGTVTASLWGPFPAKPKPADCAAQPAPAAQATADVTADAKGAATGTSSAVTVPAPGWYTWTDTIPGTPLQDDVVTACGAASETFLVAATPALSLSIDGDPSYGHGLDADLTLSGSLPGSKAKVALTMFGPFAGTPTATDCTAKLKATSTTATFRGDETVTALTVLPTLTGYYTWTASLPPAPGQEGARITCGDPGSTFAVTRDDVGALDVTNTSTAGATKPATKPRATPASLTVSAADKGANLKAPLVGMSRAGNGVGTPDDIRLAGELDVGAHVGDPWGTVIVTGRVGDAQGEPGALFPLQRVAPGDTITLTDTNGRTGKFTVDTVGTLPRVQPLPAALFPQGQATPLRLVVLTATDATTYGGGLVTHVSHWIVTATAQ